MLRGKGKLGKGECPNCWHVFGHLSLNSETRGGMKAQRPRQGPWRKRCPAGDWEAQEERQERGQVEEDFKKEDVWPAESKPHSERERERQREVENSQHLGPSAPAPPGPAHWQCLPTPLGWLSLISHGPPCGRVEGGSACRQSGRWPAAYSAGPRTPLKWLRWSRGKGD